MSLVMITMGYSLVLCLTHELKNHQTWKLMFNSRSPETPGSVQDKLASNLGTLTPTPSGIGTT